MREIRLFGLNQMPLRDKLSALLECLAVCAASGVWLFVFGMMRTDRLCKLDQVFLFEVAIRLDRMISIKSVLTQHAIAETNWMPQ